eukprot:SAG11_NODE_30857_length_296_cov_101.512690_2_plen_32_part_01
MGGAALGERQTPRKKCEDVQCKKAEYPNVCRS